MTTVTIHVENEHTAELLTLLQRWNSPAQAIPEVRSLEQANPEIASPAPAEPAVSLEALRQELTKVSQAGKTAQVKTLLAEFGARNVKELKSADFAAVLEKAGAL
jgi:hypothetical protein